MTLDDIKAMTEDFITPATAAKVMKMDPGRLIQYARDGALPFQVVISGNRVKIPRKAFLEAYGALEEEKEEDRTLETILKELHQTNVMLDALCIVCTGLMRHLAPEEYQMFVDAASGKKEGTKQ